MRIALLALTLAATPVFAGQNVALRSAPADSDGSVTLGDLFEGAGAAAKVVVAPGPAAGASVVLDAARVQAVARSAGLTWPNAAGLRRIAVRSGPAAAATPPGASVSSSAQAAEVLVYARSLKAGEVLTGEDLTWSAVSTRVPTDAPEDAEDLIGLAAKKPLRAGAPAALRDVAAAKVIAKDETVSVQFRSGGVALTLQGKAMTSAALGETLRVLNPQSKMIIDAVAAGPGVAVVGREAGSLAPTRLASRP